MPTPAVKHFEKYECKTQAFSVPDDEERLYANPLFSFIYPW